MYSSSKKILFINPCKTFFKKEIDEIIKIKQMNFGLLSMASMYPKNIIIFDCQNSTNYINDIEEIIIKNNIKYIGISLISSYTEKESFKISIFIRKKFPEITIIFGGKDCAAFIADDLITNGLTSAVITGEGELFIHQFIEEDRALEACEGIKYLNKDGNIKENLLITKSNYLPTYDHSLYPSYKEYVPSIEISRGCPHSCLFCTNRNSPILQKSPETIYNEATNIKKQYKREDIAIYFQTPHCYLKPNHLITLAKLRSEKDFVWRTQTRIEYLKNNTIELLFKAGARVIDIGMESASPNILTIMKKTKHPNDYIQAAATALKKAHEVGLILKLNIMLFAGETQNTLMETINFLKENLYNFHTISVYPVLVYPSPGENDFIKKIRSVGAEICTSKESKRLHYVNLSPSISHEKALLLSTLIAKSLQSKTAYMNQRLLGYYPQSILKNTYSKEKLKDLPFYSSEEEKKQAEEQLMKELANL